MRSAWEGTELPQHGLSVEEFASLAGNCLNVKKFVEEFTNRPIERIAELGTACLGLQGSVPCGRKCDAADGARLD